MVEIQSAQLVAQALSPGAGHASQSSVGTVDASQAVRFRSLLESSDPTVVQPSPATMQDVSAARSVAASQRVTDPNATGAVQPPSLGDSILQGLDRVRGSFNEHWATVNRLVDPAVGPVSTSNMLQLQASMMHMSMEYQLVSTVVSKTAQNIDQLVKMQ